MKIKHFLYISDLQGRVPINKALNNSKYKFKDIFLDVRSKICLNCGENLNSPNNYFIKLPCECRICTKKCFLNYILKVDNLLFVDM